MMIPDFVKPLKTGMAKLNNKMSKGNQKTSVIPYSQDSSPIDLECINTQNYSNDDAKVGIFY